MKKAWIIRAMDNGTAEIFLYGFIDSFDVSAGDFVKELRTLEQTNQNINVRINSGGGNVFEGLAIYNAMKQSKCNIETYVDGLAASMGSIIALGGSKCHMSKTARIMTHQPSAGSYGTKEELEKNIKLLEGIEKTMLAIYGAKTGKSEEECKTAFMNGSDCWFDADQALEAGLVDAIYDAEPVAVPAEAKAEHDVWDAYNLKFAAVLNNAQNPNNNMDLTMITAENKTALGIGDAIDAVGLNAKIADLVAKAAQADEYKTKMEAAEQKLADAEKQAKAEKVDTILGEATAKKGISAELKATLKADYAENPEGLQKIVDGMPEYKTVTGQLRTGGTETTEELVAEWNKLDKSKGGLETLKAENIDRYKELFLAKFKKEYEG